jgi:hypothetical protein
MIGRLFLRLNERDYNIYKEEHQDIPARGRCLIFCIFKIVSLPSQEGFLIFNHSNSNKNESCSCRGHRAGRF